LQFSIHLGLAYQREAIDLNFSIAAFGALAGSEAYREYESARLAYRLAVGGLPPRSKSGLRTEKSGVSI
jgi:hypothetical protein